MSLHSNIGAPEVNCKIYNIGASTIFYYFSKWGFSAIHVGACAKEHEHTILISSLKDHLSLCYLCFSLQKKCLFALYLFHQKYFLQHCTCIIILFKYENLLYLLNRGGSYWHYIDLCQLVSGTCFQPVIRTANTSFRWLSYPGYFSVCFSVVTTGTVNSYVPYIKHQQWNRITLNYFLWLIETYLVLECVYSALIALILYLPMLS